MKQLILVRHGETDYNQKRLMQGQSNIPLNKTGLSQAYRVAQVLKNVPIDALWSSPLSRAFETTESIAKHHQLTIQTDILLIERSFGDFEGRPHEELNNFEKRTNSTNASLKIPNGESLDELLSRAQQLVDRIKSTENVGTLLMVGHAGIFRAIIGALLNWPLDKWMTIQQHNTCINTLNFDDDGVVVAYQLDEHEHCR